MKTTICTVIALAALGILFVWYLETTFKEDNKYQDD